MYKTVAEKKEFVKSVLCDSYLFEKYILNVHSDDDRLEIMKILSKKLIRVDLREDLNFLHMKDFGNFKFSLIVNLLFKEMANEWIGFAKERLSYSKEKALDEIQEKSRVMFIYSLVKQYFDKYKKEYLREIANTFFELVAMAPVATLSNQLVKDVLASKLLKKDNVPAYHSYYQLWTRTKKARNVKNLNISAIQVKISEMASKIDSNALSEEESLKVQDKLAKRKAYLKSVQDKSFVEFDESLKRARDAMVDSMLDINSFS